MSLAPGTRLGPYEILATIGAGGMGEIYKARDTRLDRIVAIKVSQERFSDRFECEARAVAALNHPHICTLHDVGPDYLVMEYVEGTPLKGPLPLDRAVEYAGQILDALDAAHQKGIIHRDLKPANILVTRDGRVKILDFGLAKIADSHVAAAETETLTEPGVVLGTVGYMSPEQVRGAPADHRSDIFSFGLILHELLTGKRTFHGETSVDTMQAILRKEPPELPENVPTQVRQIVSHCLEKDPANRFQSVKDLGFALAQSVNFTSASGVTQEALAIRSAGRQRVLGALAVLGLIAAGVIVGRLLWRTSAPASWAGVLFGGPEYALMPRLSPEGHLLAFQTLERDNQQIAVMKPESSNWQILTHNRENGFINRLCWSADGTRIYYDRWTDVARGVFSVPVLGGEEQLILEDAGLPEALPDGSLLVIRFNAERRRQMFRFWPETGRLQGYPLEQQNNSPVRIFPGGHEAIAIGTLIGPGKESGQHLYLIDLASGSVRHYPTGSLDESALSTLAVTRDGASILLVQTAGRFSSVVAMPRNGGGTPRAMLALTMGVDSLDTGPDGSIYLDQLDNPGDLVRFSPEGGRVETIARFPAFELGPGDGFTVLPDGRAVLTQRAGGRVRLMVAGEGRAVNPLIITTEETSSPVTALGLTEIAFLIGPEPRRTIAVAASSNGRISRRIPFDKGPITSLASTPDGKTLYCAAGGTVWAIPSAGGQPMKIRAGDYVAVDPAGQFLLVELRETPKIRLVRVPLNGGKEQEITQAGPFRLAYFIEPNAIGKDGRILTSLGSATWDWPPGFLDPYSGRTTRFRVDYVGDFEGMNWTPDGRIIGRALSNRSTIWKFTPHL